jgi:hypothetical protein
LGELVCRLREKLTTDFPNTAEELDEKLIRAGYLDVDVDMYVVKRFQLQEAYGYLVSDHASQDSIFLPQLPMRSTLSMKRSWGLFE